MNISSKVLAMAMVAAFGLALAQPVSADKPVGGIHTHVTGGPFAPGTGGGTSATNASCSMSNDSNPNC